MKKLFALILAVAMLGCFVACGDNSSTDSSTDNGEVQATSVKFSAESYEVKIGGFNKISKNMVIEPADAKVVYEISDESIATIDKRGEVTGIAQGTVTVTVKSADGKALATATVHVKGYGTISSFNEDKTEGGIKYKRFGTPEVRIDSDAIIVIISKNIDKSIDKTDITTLNYGEKDSDGYYTKAGSGYYVVRNNNREGDYIINDVPFGEYLGLIISSKDQSVTTGTSNYDKSAVLSQLKASKLGDYLSETELTALAANSAFEKSLFYVGEFTVNTSGVNTFGHTFAVD